MTVLLRWRRGPEPRDDGGMARATDARAAARAADRSARRSTGALPWALPLGVLGVALLWSVPFASRSGAARALVDEAIGNWVLLVIWLVWSTSLAMVASSLERADRSLGRGWTVVQAGLLLLVVVWALPPVLLAAPTPLEASASFAAHFVLLPVLALALSALQALVLFFRA